MRRATSDLGPGGKAEGPGRTAIWGLLLERKRDRPRVGILLRAVGGPGWCRTCDRGVGRSRRPPRKA